MKKNYKKVYYLVNPQKMFVLGITIKMFNNLIPSFIDGTNLAFKSMSPELKKQNNPLLYQLKIEAKK